MSTLPEVVRQGELINQLVIDRATLEELGRIEVLWMYPQSHRVLGFICKTGFLTGKKYAFKLSQIAAFGTNGVLTQGTPEPTDAEKVSQLESLLNHEVWNDAGSKIGKITDCLFNLQSGAIAHYLFVSNGLSGIAGDVYQLPANYILRFGKKRVLVPEAAAERFAVYRPGIQQKLSKAKESLTQEASQELRSLTHQAQTIAGQTKERLLDLTEQTRERAKHLREHLQEDSKSWLDRAKETTKGIADRVKEQTQSLSKQVEERLESLAVQDDEMDDSWDLEIEGDRSQSSPEDPKTPSSEAQKQPKPTTDSPWDDDDDEPWI